MRKLFFSMCSIAIAVTAIFVWSHTALTPSQAASTTTINPTEMMSNYTGTLPVEQWDAI
jgi:hypothetical protein